MSCDSDTDFIIEFLPCRKTLGMVNQVMVSDATEKSGQLLVSHNIEGCSTEVLNYAPEVSDSNKFDVKARKKCVSCTGILHDQETVQPLASFHERCFHCNRCEQQLSPLNFKMVNGMPYCEPICQNVRVQKISHDMNQISCSNTTFNSTNRSTVKNMGSRSPQDNGVHASISHQCAVCEEVCNPRESFTKGGFFYHARCLKCDICNALVDINDNTWVGGRPYCEQHYLTTTKGYKKTQMKNSSRNVTTNGERTIPIQISDQISKKPPQKHPVQVVRIVQPQISASLDNLSEMSSSHSTGRHKSVTIERKMNNHMESGISMYTRKSHTPPMKRLVQVESRRNSMSSLSNTTAEHYCGVCGKIVYPSARVGHKSRIYHDTCIRCEICDRPLTANTMNVLEGTILCNKHYRSNTLTRTDDRSMRSMSLERIKHVSSEDENSVTIDDSGTMFESGAIFDRSTNILKVPSHSVNRKPPNSPRTSYTLSSPISSSPRENQQEYRIQTRSPYEKTTSSWSGEISRQIKTKTEISRIRTVNQ